MPGPPAGGVRQIANILAFCLLNVKGHGVMCFLNPPKLQYEGSETPTTPSSLSPINVNLTTQRVDCQTDGKTHCGHGFPVACIHGCAVADRTRRHSRGHYLNACDPGLRDYASASQCPSALILIQEFQVPSSPKSSDPASLYPIAFVTRIWYNTLKM